MIRERTAGERTVLERRSLAPARIGRLRWIAGMAVFVYGGVLLPRALYLLHDSRLAPVLQKQGMSAPRESRLRGNIVDRRGQLLVGRGDVDSIEAVPAAIEDKRQIARVLAETLRVPVAEIQRELGRKSRHVYLRRWLTEEQSARLRPLLASDDEEARVRPLRLKGVYVIRERRGKYPNQSLAAPFLGVAGYDEVGLKGVEKVFDAALRGVDGSPGARADAASAAELLRGATVQLALDALLQSKAEQILLRALEESGALHASLLALDPRSGDILVAAEAPSFDPYQFRDVDAERSRLRCFTEPFEPGSTIKPFSMAVALESGIVKSGQAFFAEQGYWAERDLHDHAPHGWLELGECLIVSSNICLAKVADLLGSERLVSGLRRLGFGDKRPSIFPGTTAGLVRDLRESQFVDRGNLSFGQGMRASALQLALAAAVLANGGVRVAPRLALSIQRGSLREAVPVELGPRVLSEPTARQVLAMMEHSITDEEGTGNAAAIPGYRVAGKTGTAQKPLLGGKGYSKQFTASFLGIVPADEPRLVVVVVLDEPKRPKHTGGLAAAPVFRSFAAAALEQLSIPSAEPLTLADGGGSAPVRAPLP